MQKFIKNVWLREPGGSFAYARILRHEIHPEGLDVERIRFFVNGDFVLDSQIGHIISVLRGKGGLRLRAEENRTYQLETGVHFYLPPGREGVLTMEPDAELLHVLGPSASQACGKKFLLRDERFLAACASGSQMLRWILTPQYLSRRIFLHHDPVLLSKSGHPVSWFHTTMFDVAGLPKNEEGEPVFKMSYNSRTEVNFCYQVKGTARVRMAQHPYVKTRQVWGPWFPLDGESTYHLNEAAGGDEEEYLIDEATGARQIFRNRHEVFIIDGYVSLFCLFDPAPTGIEHHRPGEYSDYEPLSQVLGTEAYETYAREIRKYDEMVDCLSMARAADRLDGLQGTLAWKLYLRGREDQAFIEKALEKKLAAEGSGREKVLGPWMRSVHEKARS